MCRISLVNLEKSLTPEMCMLTILKATKDFSMLNIENINETKVKVGNLWILPPQSVYVNVPVTYQGLGIFPFNINHSYIFEN